MEIQIRDTVVEDVLSFVRCGRALTGERVSVWCDALIKSRTVMYVELEFPLGKQKEPEYSPIKDHKTLQSSINQCYSLRLYAPYDENTRSRFHPPASPFAAQSTDPTSTSQTQSLGLGTPLLAATCSIKGRNLPLKVMTTRFSPSFPVVVPTSMKKSMADMMPSPHCSLMSVLIARP